MSKLLDLRVDFETDDWLDSFIIAKDGVLSGYVTLRIRGREIIHYYPRGMNNSAISLVRSAIGDHAAATEASALNAEWPLFFCDGGLKNRCGVIHDFSVTHRNGSVLLSQFYNCEVPASTRFVLPWRTWARTAERLGTDVLRRLPPTKRGISARYRPMYLRYRGLLRSELRALRHQLSLKHADR